LTYHRFVPAYDYSAVADIYDDFCVFDGDIDFFRKAVTPISGPVLELMAGTGRVSLPLIRDGVRLTCVDRFPSMLAVLTGKLRSEKLSARLVCADVCSLPFGEQFALVILPFQGFTELVGAESQGRIFEEAARALSPGGRFICTSHNPAVRSATIDGEWHEIGRFRLPMGRVLVLRLRTSHADRPGVVEGTQLIEIIDQDGKTIETREIDLEFSLVAPQRVVRLAVSAGFRPLRWFGDYRQAAFDEDSSPVLIIEFEKVM
jgi:SAM-dependent methyltransferase